VATCACPHLRYASRDAVEELLGDFRVCGAERPENIFDDVLLDA
jgi:hypothetical protein